jgi:hypothetical protein
MVVIAVISVTNPELGWSVILFNVYPSVDDSGEVKL